jgi:hypothetical protein
MQRSVQRCALVLAISLTPTDVFAVDAASGTVMGAVVDEAGAPMRQVKITARSERGIGEPRVVYTGADGTFRLVGLAPGTFEVTAVAVNRKTKRRTGVVVTGNAPAELTLSLELDTDGDDSKAADGAAFLPTRAIQSDARCQPRRFATRGILPRRGLRPG